MIEFFAKFWFSLFATFIVMALGAAVWQCGQSLPPPLPPVADRCDELQKYLDAKDCGIDIVPACRDYAHVGMSMPACAYSASTCKEALTCQ